MTPSSENHPPGKHDASFRDPSGYVFFRQGRVFRAIDEKSARVFGQLADQGVLDELQEEKLVVETTSVDDQSPRDQLAHEHPSFESFLEHRRVDNITYPYEWSISMCADAAVLTLDLQMRLLRAGFSLKDASAYNVQFVDGRPLFIDLGSFEEPARLDVWFALGQFTRMFTLPLLLCRYCGWDMRSYFLGRLDGRNVEEVVRGLGWFERWRPRMILDVTLPELLTRWPNRSSKGSAKSSEKKSGGDAEAQLWNLRRLRSKVSKLAAGYKPRGVWTDYERDCSYDDTAESAKKEMVAWFIESSKPGRVLDLGCNRGEYSRLAADAGAQVTAVDADHDVIESLYRDLRNDPARITPMVVDICNPSPAIGYMNRERESFFDRNRADCVLALALAHHLLISGNLPVTAVRDMMWELTARDLVIEFIPPEDEMFRRLLRFRKDLFGDLSLDAFREAFLARFDLLDERPIPNSKRIMLFLRKK